jgi:hypothetical protein
MHSKLSKQIELAKIEAAIVFNNTFLPLRIF